MAQPRPFDFVSFEKTAPTEEPRRFNQAISCLRRHKRSFGLLTRALRDADRQQITLAAALVESLPPLDACDDAAYVDRVEPDVEDARLDAAYERLYEAELERVSGRPQAAATLVRGVTALAEELGRAPLAAEATFVEGKVMRTLGDYAGATAALEEAYYVADTAELDRLRGDIAGELAGVMIDRHELERARSWAEQVGAAAARAGRTAREHNRSRAPRALAGQAVTLRSTTKSRSSSPAAPSARRGVR